MWLNHWRRGPVAVLVLGWVIGTSAILILYFLGWARDLERSFEAMGYRLGATSAEFHVNLLSAWPQLTFVYLLIVILPPTVFVWYWRRVRGHSGQLGAP